MQFDNFDLKILAALQENGSLQDLALSELINLKTDEVKTRRQRLETEGIVEGYHAFINRTNSGFDIFAFIQITLSDYERAAAEKFGQFLRNSPYVLEAHAMTEDMDFLVKIVVSSLEDLSSIINDQLEAHESVKSARAIISLETIKETTNLPI